jgi:hypothetical protein
VVTAGRKVREHIRHAWCQQDLPESVPGERTDIATDWLPRIRGVSR